MPSRTRFRFAASTPCLIGALLLPALAHAIEPAAPASRQPAPSAAKPAAPTAPGTDPPVTETAPSSEVLLEAKQRFDRGFELYEEGEYPLALIEFRRAYDLVPNYKVLYNIGQVCIQLGQYANARRALEEYVEKGGDALTHERRAAVKKDLDMLGRRTAFLTVGANIEGAEVLVDDVSMGKTPMGPALLVDAGVHRVTLRRDGYLPKTASVTLAGGDEQTLTVTLELQPEEKQTIVVREQIVEERPQTWIIAGWITTGALVAGAVVTGIMGSSEASELEKLRGAYSPDYDDLGGRIDDTKSNARALFLASDVMSGAALIVGGISLWITLAPHDREDARSPATPAAKPAPGMQVGYADGQLRLRGAF